MLLHNKRQPTFDDLSLMPFGKYKGSPMQDVPASYLNWLKEKGGSGIVLLDNYIHNNWEAIQQELNNK